jgi:hypothetical protein
MLVLGMVANLAGSAGSLAQEAANTPSSAVIPPDLTDRAGPHHR